MSGHPAVSFCQGSHEIPSSAACTARYTWEPLNNLTNFKDSIAAFEQVTGRTLTLTGFTVEVAQPGDLGAALVGRTVLYWWPDDGWQRGTVACLCPRGAFWHVVAYTRQTSALRCTADTLLDAASYGSSWVLLAGPGGGCGPGRPRPPPTLTKLSIVGGSSQLPVWAGRLTDIHIECSCLCCLFRGHRGQHCSVYLWFKSLAEITNVLYRIMMDSAIVPDRRRSSLRCSGLGTRWFDLCFVILLVWSHTSFLLIMIVWLPPWCHRVPTFQMYTILKTELYYVAAVTAANSKKKDHATCCIV